MDLRLPCCLSLYHPHVLRLRFLWRHWQMAALVTQQGRLCDVSLQACSCSSGQISHGRVDAPRGLPQKDGESKVPLSSQQGWSEGSTGYRRNDDISCPSAATCLKNNPLLQLSNHQQLTQLDPGCCEWLSEEGHAIITQSSSVGTRWGLNNNRDSPPAQSRHRRSRTG
jgi:hypothetical protein